MLRNSTIEPWPRKPMWPLSRAQARVLPVVHRAPGAGGVEVGVDHGRAVDDDLDVPSLDRDLLGVPLPDRPQDAAARRHHAVDRAVVLVRLEAPVHRRAVLEDLELHPDVGGVALERGADAEPVVGGRGQLELEAEDEVGVLLLRVQVPPAALGTDDDLPVLGGVAGEVAGPALEVAAVEERPEALARLGGAHAGGGGVGAGSPGRRGSGTRAGCRGPAARSVPSG